MFYSHNQGMVVRLPRNPQKQPCAVKDCKNWAMQGADRCFVHQLTLFRGGASAESSDPTLKMIVDVAQQIGHVATADDLELIGQELAHLYAARWAFLSWVRQANQAADGEGSESGETNQGQGAVSADVPPARFLKAWSDSTARVIQLLRARRELVGQGQGQAIQGLEEALDLLAASYPALDDATPQTKPLPGFGETEE